MTAPTSDPIALPPMPSHGWSYVYYYLLVQYDRQ